MIRDSKFIAARAAAAVAACALFCAPAGAQVPDLVPYQGYLTDDGGNPYPGDSVSLTFRIYADADSPGAIWSEQWNDVPVFDGVFYAYLGMNSPVADVLGSGNARYLGVSIAGVGEASPRQRMGSVPYALMARDARSLQGYAAEDFATRGEMGNYARWDELGARGYTTQEWVENYVEQTVIIDADAFVSQAWIDEQGYATEDWVRTYVGDQGHATEDWVRTYVGDQGFVGADALEGHASEQWVRDQGYTTEDWVRGYVGDQGYLRADALDGYATEQWVRDYVGQQGYLTADDLNGYASEQWVRDYVGQQGYLTGAALDGHATEQWVRDQGYVDAAGLAGAVAAAAATYVTGDDLDGRGYATEQWVVDQGYLTGAQLDARGYATVVSVDTLRADVSRTYVSNVALDARGFIDAAALDARGYASADDVGALRDRVDALEAAIEQIAAATSSFLLGRSNQSSNGRFSFNGRTGIRAANEMCRTTYPNEPTAHFCSPDEVFRAVASGSYTANARATTDQVWTWTISQGAITSRGANSLGGNCQNLMYNSADVANGTRVRVDFDYQSNGNGGGLVGDVVRIDQEVGCGNNYPVLCCR